jgi:hypothetical protein
METTVTATDIRDLKNHVMHFGNYAVVQKRGSRWWVSFRGFGPPSPFKTKREAGEYVSLWTSMVGVSS